MSSEWVLSNDNFRKKKRVRKKNKLQYEFHDSKTGISEVLLKSSENFNRLINLRMYQVTQGFLISDITSPGN